MKELEIIRERQKENRDKLNYIKLHANDKPANMSQYLFKALENKYNEKQKNEIKTEILKKREKIKEKKFNISLFDTAGQEKFRAITFNYFKGADGIFLLYDITDRQTFDNVEMWVDSIKQAIDSNEESKNAIVLIGNKLDLIEDGLKERQVTEDEARNISEYFVSFICLNLSKG